MGERKGLAKYYPPDFDPSKLPRIKRPKDGQISSHFMLPMSIRCLTCGEFMGAGLKFNAKKSTAAETYLGTKIFRFSMRCKACPAAFIIRTDPQNSDYACESGAKRNFAAWRAEKADKEAEEKEEEDAKGDVMKELEEKTLDARKEMEDLDRLDELRVVKARNARVSADVLLGRHKEAFYGEEEIMEEARAAWKGVGERVRRIEDDEGGGGIGSGSRAGAECRKDGGAAVADKGGLLGVSTSVKRKAPAGFVVVKKKAKALPAAKVAPSEPAVEDSKEEAPSGLGLGAYGSDSDSSSSSADGDKS